MAPQNRREFVKSAAAIGALAAIAPRLRAFAPPRKLRIGLIGVANRGGDNLEALAGEDVVALCDVDRNYLDAAAARFPAAKPFRDYREMLATDGLMEAAVVSTPDHHHFPAAKRALEKGLHVYCEKPLTHTVAQARTLTELAKSKGLVTQMGTQIHAGDNCRRVVEKIRSGAIGAVREVHVFCEKTWSGRGAPQDHPPVPPTLDWDLWLGPAAPRPYSADYHPASWRRYWAFGGGTLADMGCHYLDLAHWALDLSHCVAVRADGPEVDGEATPEWLRVEWEHPARGAMPPVRVTWYDHTCRPDILAALGLNDWMNGVLFVGAKGYLISDYDRNVMGPDAAFSGYVAPPASIATSVGHHREWVNACLEGTPTTCAFAYSGPLTECVLLGNVAYRVGRRLEWDAAKLRVTNCDAANDRLHEAARPAWA